MIKPSDACGTAAPAVTLNATAHSIGARSITANDFYNNLANHPFLLSFLMTQLANMQHSSSSSSSSRPIREEERRKHQQIHEQQRTYVNALVDVTVQAIASIWPNSTSTPTTGGRPIATINTFLHHILKHSRTTHSTLQLAIFYLFRVRPRIQEKKSHDDVYVSCGRRMFLAALICAHKFLQDKTYKNSAWSKVSGLDVSEINHAEKVMLQLLDYQLYVKKETYDQWIGMLQNHLKLQPMLPTPPAASPAPAAVPALIKTTSLPASPAEEDHLQTPPSSVSETKIPHQTIMKLGMLTPVELNASMMKIQQQQQHSTMVLNNSFGLLSPPELDRKRKNSIDLHQDRSVKRRI
ncbi:hypothetical protein EC973_002486 [Apophysomyces ossiformis]|uniref:Uncharacterized protein n=1 Tax=Apophysomyces ossiformis TaxID=679940 RepID=A0A8H7ET23_9FUNG|nr:hypothetical protein EC973_002486 [Apophysomyces ossiformis]